MRSFPYVSFAASGATVAAALALAPVLALAAAAPAAADGPDSNFSFQDDRITESSGLAASRAHPGIYWTHNDQDQPRVFAVDSRTGKTVATVTMKGVGTPRDMEAISVGPDGKVYVGDIGDNKNGTWKHVWIYSFPEPARLRDATVRATQYTVKYDDGPRDAEALMVHPKTGRVYIASKNEDGGGLYEAPAKLNSSGTNVFRRIAKDLPWVTDGAFSPDGKRVVFRSYFSARGYAWTAQGRLGADDRVKGPMQVQSEGVSYTADGKALMFGSEGQGAEVRRVDLKDAGRGAGPAPGGGEASSKGGGSASADGGGSEGDESVDLTTAVVVGAGALAALLLVKRLFRRRA
ncbi:PD40 domain-containing protein [Streptomyces qinzhouensis]|uniref:WD40 repeat domain-containing protein n=1 Tax=Streptomyces qinzhouensis TaxID=2599401 RepID=A0A5B8J7P0_9ACTN|nr:PD40 domain-containing protein [Streptomyces qinzhouensis]QDY77417.1 WD40 repeat domain-containing protein [Streptomyces qinzhouensis]